MTDPSPKSAQTGILAILAVTVLFACMDATAKVLGETYEPFFVVWARYAGQAVGTLLVFAPRLRQVLRTTQLKLQVFRSTLLFGATILFFTGFALLPLAEAVAIAQVAPLFIMVMAALVLGERVGPYRWGAVAAGFIGALVIIRPGTEAFDWNALFPLGGAFLFASFSIATRYLGASDTVWTTFVYTGTVGALAASLAVPFFWQTPAVADLPLLVLIGVIGAAGQAMLILAMRFAAASLVAPFLYIQLVWSVSLGYGIFGEIPEAPTLAGAAIVVVAGLVIHWREQVASRRG